MTRILATVFLFMLLVGCSTRETREAKYDGGQLKEKYCVKFDAQKNQVKDGPFTALYKNGQKELECTYKNGKLDGRYNSWYEYENGQKEKECTYKDGKLDGKYTQWYESGLKEEECAYKDRPGLGLVFALLIAAIIWNMGTWCGSVCPHRVRHAGRLHHRSRNCQQIDVRKDRNQRRGLGPGDKNIGKSLLLRPLVGFVGAALLLLCKAVIPEQATLRSTRRATGRAVLDSRAAGADLHGHQLYHGWNRTVKGYGA